MKKPTNGQVYWTVAYGLVVVSYWRNDRIDKQAYKLGLIYYSSEEAEKEGVPKWNTPHNKY